MKTVNRQEVQTSWPRRVSKGFSRKRARRFSFDFLHLWRADPTPVPTHYRHAVAHSNGFAVRFGLARPHDWRIRLPQRANPS